MASGQRGPPGASARCHVGSVSSLVTGSVPGGSSLAVALHVLALTVKIKSVLLLRVTVSLLYVSFYCHNLICEQNIRLEPVII